MAAFTKEFFAFNGLYASTPCCVQAAERRWPGWQSSLWKTHEHKGLGFAKRRRKMRSQPVRRDMADDRRPCKLLRARRGVLVLDGRRPGNRLSSFPHGFFGQDREEPIEMIGETSAAFNPCSGHSQRVAVAAGNRRVLGAISAALSVLPWLRSRIQAPRRAAARRDLDSSGDAQFPVGGRLCGSHKASSKRRPRRPFLLDARGVTIERGGGGSARRRA